MTITMQLDYDQHGKQGFVSSCGEFDMKLSSVCEGKGEIMFYKEWQPLSVPVEIVLKDLTEGVEVAVSCTQPDSPARLMVDSAHEYCLEWKNRPLLELKPKKAHVVTYFPVV